MQNLELNKLLSENPDYWRADSGSLHDHAQKLRYARSLLADEESREIFDNRLLWHIIGGEKYVRNLANRAIRRMDKFVQDKCIEHWEMIDKNILTRNAIFRLDAFIDRVKELLAVEQIVVYGAEGFGRLILECLPLDANLIVCDRRASEIGETFCGYPLISPEQLAESYLNHTVAITPMVSGADIFHSLLKIGVKQEKMFILKLWYENPVHMYFDSEVLTPLHEEYYVDVGMCNCHTIRQFIEWCNSNRGSYTKILGLEPHPSSFESCCKEIDDLGLRDVEILWEAAWNEKTMLDFDVSGAHPAWGHVLLRNDSGEGVSVPANTIDNILNGEKCTLIKMDIEGSETKALQGARETIMKWHPRLAISYYHRFSDLYELPLLIYSYSDKYRFYLRHYSTYSAETVLYAV